MVREDCQLTVIIRHYSLESYSDCIIEGIQAYDLNWFYESPYKDKT